MGARKFFTALILLVLLIPLASGNQTPTSAHPAADRPGDAQHEELVEESGERVWVGEVNGRVAEIDDLLAPMVEAAPEVFAGRMLTPDRQRLEIRTVAPESPLVDELRKAVGPDFDDYVTIIPVKFSQRQLDEAADRLVDLDWEAAGIQSVSVDIARNGVRLGISARGDRGQDLLRLGRIDSDSRVASELAPISTVARDTGVTIWVAEDDELSATGTRLNDAPAYSWWGGDPE
ncbi:MAG: hypothetical protein Q4P33_08080 [Flaviflexus sp.]|nr:hypothetical protein [Flaviflexus sp.]